MNISGETANTFGRLANSGLEIELVFEHDKVNQASRSQLIWNQMALLSLESTYIDLLVRNLDALVEFRLYSLDIFRLWRKLGNSRRSQERA
jgi:hypothetical protein